MSGYGKENCSFFWFNLKLSKLRVELAACYLRSCGLVSCQVASKGSGVRAPLHPLWGSVGWPPARLTAQDVRDTAPLKMMFQKYA